MRKYWKDTLKDWATKSGVFSIQQVGLRYKLTSEDMYIVIDREDSRRKFGCLFTTIGYVLFPLVDNAEDEEILTELGSLADIELSIAAYDKQACAECFVTKTISSKLHRYGKNN